MVLDESNCDVRSNPSISASYDAGDIDSVGAFFAMKMIYETGGLYIGRRIIAEAPFDYVRYYNSVFFYIDYKNFSDNLFGGYPGAKVFEEILSTYDTVFYTDPAFPMARRIKNILFIKHDIPLDGKTYIFKYDTSVFAPSVASYGESSPCFSSPIHFCHHDYSDLDRSEYPCVPKALVGKSAVKAASACSPDPNAKRFKSYLKKYRSLKYWQKFFVLFFLNRDLCRIRVKEKLAGHRILLWLLKKANRFCKKVKIFKY